MDFTATQLDNFHSKPGFLVEHGSHLDFLIFSNDSFTSRNNSRLYYSTLQEQEHVQRVSQHAWKI